MNLGPVLDLKIRTSGGCQFKNSGKLHTIIDFKAGPGALAGVAQWIEYRPANQKVPAWLPARVHAWVVGEVHSWGHVRGSHATDVSFPLFLPLSPFLQK